MLVYYIIKQGEEPQKNPHKVGDRRKGQMKTFTTAQAIAKATTEAAKHLAKGEDIRKVYPIEGTGKGGQWLDCKVWVEIDNAETGEHLRDLVLEVYKAANPSTKTRTIKAIIF